MAEEIEIPISEEDLATLEEEAERRDVDMNTLINQLLEEHLATETDR